MYIVKKKISGREYYYLNKSVRERRKVKTKTIAYLGKDEEEARKKAKELIKEIENKELKTKEASKKDILNKEQMKATELKPQKISVEDLASFCKRKGFVYLSGEIYGGFSGFWDFGPLGVELKNNIKREWWKFHVQQRQDMVGIDGSILTHPKVWQASGHVDSFSDISIQCKKCKKINKIDKNEIGKVKCEFCQGELDEKTAKEINLMFRVEIGPLGSGVESYLRPETAQLMFANFKSVVENARLKLPFGIAQIGKAYRNEISPRDFLFRMREFEQMEIEYFVKPGQKCQYMEEIGNTKILVYSDKMQEENKEPEKMKILVALKKGIIKTDWHAYWLFLEYNWFTSLGANPEKFRIRQHKKDEKSHYAFDTWDLEYEFPFGWKELQGMANRTDFDLKQHERFSGKDLKIYDEQTKEKFLPHVIAEPSQGVERAFLVFMFDAYHYDSQRDNVVLMIHPKLAPVKAAVFPIVNKHEFIKISKDITTDLSNEFNVQYDQSGSLGRRYSRQDEIGTPLCITIDQQTLKDKTVTIRDRDTTEQIRVKITDLRDIIRRIVEGENILKLGKIIKTRKK